MIIEMPRNGAMPTVDIDSREAITTLLRSHGNLMLAAERCFGVCTPDTLAALAIACAGDMPNLKKSINAALILGTYSLLDSVIAEMMTAIPRLEPEQKVSAFKSVVGLLQNLSDDKTTTHNINWTEYVWDKEVPADIKDIIQELKLLESGADNQEAE